MSRWLEAAERFEERPENNDYFEMQSSLGAIEKIRSITQTLSPQLIFLIGEPGSGKSFLLRHLSSIWASERDLMLIETPFLSPMEFLRKLLKHRGIDYAGDDIEGMRQAAIDAYTHSNHLIMIDEAQLLSPEMKEFIRILSDTKAFWFVIAMHRHESEAILRSPHFKSRPHRIIELFSLSQQEAKSYLHQEVNRGGFPELVEELTPLLITQAYRISEGNFRNFKKIFHHLFHLLHYTNTHNKSRYLRPSECTITMAAMNAELIHD